MAALHEINRSCHAVNSLQKCRRRFNSRKKENQNYFFRFENFSHQSIWFEMRWMHSIERKKNWQNYSRSKKSFSLLKFQLEEITSSIETNKNPKKMMKRKKMFSKWFLLWNILQFVRHFNCQWFIIHQINADQIAKISFKIKSLSFHFGTWIKMRKKELNNLILNRIPFDFLFFFCVKCQNCYR